MSINVDLETGNLFYLERTLESQYLDGRFGALPIIDWDEVGGRPFSPQYTRGAVEITDRKKLAKRLRTIAKQIESGL